MINPVAWQQTTIINVSLLPKIDVMLNEIKVSENVHLKIHNIFKSTLSSIIIGYRESCIGHLKHLNNIKSGS